MMMKKNQNGNEEAKFFLSYKNRRLRWKEGKEWGSEWIQKEARKDGDKRRDGRMNERN